MQCLVLYLGRSDHMLPSQTGYTPQLCNWELILIHIKGKGRVPSNQWAQRIVCLWPRPLGRNMPINTLPNPKLVSTGKAIVFLLNSARKFIRPTTPLGLTLGAFWPHALRSCRSFLLFFSNFHSYSAVSSGISSTSSTWAFAFQRRKIFCLNLSTHKPATKLRLFCPRKQIEVHPSSH